MMVIVVMIGMIGVIDWLICDGGSRGGDDGSGVSLRRNGSRCDGGAGDVCSIWGDSSDGRNGRYKLG